LICCAANLAVQGEVKNADGKAVLVFGAKAEFTAVRYHPMYELAATSENFAGRPRAPPHHFFQHADNSFPIRPGETVSALFDRLETEILKRQFSTW